MGLEESAWWLWYCGRWFIGGVGSLMYLAWVGWREVCSGAGAVVKLVEVVVDSCITYANINYYMQRRAYLRNG
ncbi:hypothetical protein V8C44DRAFT_327197 [Trichoderma aethiopicum]